MIVSNCPICADGSPELSSSLEVLSEDPVQIVQDPVIEPAPDTAAVEETPPPAVDESIEEPDIDDQYALVGKASNEGANAARRKTWQRVAIAAAAVVVATIAIILVSLNEGRGK